MIGAGHGAAQGLRHAQIKRGISTDLLNPDADFGRRLNLGEYEREFRARDIGRDQADQW